MIEEKVIIPEDDGKTHINIYSRSPVQLGRDLSHFSDLSLNHPRYGYFRTLEGFWHWLSSGKQHDIFRELTGYQCKRERSSNYEKYAAEQVSRFEDEIIQAHVYRLEQHPGLFKALVQSSLPFEHYYVYNGAVVDLVKYSWIPKAMHDLRQDAQLKSIFDDRYKIDFSEATEAPPIVIAEGPGYELL